MNVFLTGATGYLGSHVARAFRRAGHEVFGLVRNKAKAARVEEFEIVPVIGTLEDPASYRVAAERCGLLVHVAVDYEGDTFGLDKKTVEALISSGGRGAQPKTLLYTSGSWVYGDTGDRLVDETAPLTPAKRVAWRPEIERLVLESRSVRGLAVRPGCVYGGAGGMWGDWFSPALEKKAVSIVGDGHNRWAIVHIDDLADGYVRMGESGLFNEIFNLADSSRATVEEMSSAAARAAGFSGEIKRISVAEASKKMGSYAECLALDQHVDAGKAERLLGWRPKHAGFVSGAERYFLS